MRFLLVFLLFKSSFATFIWEQAPVYQIEKNLFQKKVIDSYEANLKSQNPSLPIHDNKNEANSQNPYKSNLTKFAVYNSDFGVAPILVYNLEGSVTKSVNDVFVECYDYNDCHYQLTTSDRQELSLYASFIENSGVAPVNKPYSLGIIRSRYTTNVLGMYTEGFSQLDNQIGFWIRLVDSDNKRMYTTLSLEEKIIALLDLGVHERSHFDQPTYNANAAHCDNFQSNYNYLFQITARKFQEYKSLTKHIMNEEDTFEITTFEAILIAFVCVFLFTSIGLLLLYLSTDTYIPVANDVKPLNY